MKYLVEISCMRGSQRYVRSAPMPECIYQVMSGSFVFVAINEKKELEEIRSLLSFINSL